MMPLLVIVLAAGCGDPKVTGKVTFPDGTPLTTGQVMFQKEGFVASGAIQKDGTYSAGKQKDGDGLPLGTYQVFLAEVSIFGELSGRQGVQTSTGSVVFEVAPTVDLVPTKYMSASTSGLTVEVKRPTKFDITVEPPSVVTDFRLQVLQAK